MPASSKSRSIAGHIGNALKRDPNADTSALRRDLAESRIADRIREELSKAPPLTKAQRDRLAAILAGGA